MYAGVPSATPNDVSPPVTLPAVSERALSSASLTPKSVTTATPPDTITFSGLMSRWTIPSFCAHTLSADPAMSRSTWYRLIDWEPPSAPPFAMRSRNEFPFSRTASV